VKAVAALLIAGMILFAVWSAAREIKTYRKYLRGEKEYLVSKKRRNRRVCIAGVLIGQAVLLFLGIFILKFQQPLQMLVYWTAPTALIGVLVYLGMQDFRETSHDLDVIVREASDVILKKKD
jgi:amino acid transporter